MKPWMIIAGGAAVGVFVGLRSLDAPPAITLVDLLRQRLGIEPDGGFPPTIGSIVDFSLAWIASIPEELYGS